MPFLAISARFPLGTFLGHQATGQPATVPDTARLHAALLHAAGKGSTAVEVAGDLRPSDASLAALRWLEARPPDALGVPRSVSVSSASVPGTSSYRDDGVIEKVKGKVRVRKVLKRQSDAMAIDGALWWAWAEELTPESFAAIEALCADVSCLGESDSPVVLEAYDASVAPMEVTHRLSARQSSFPPAGGLVMRTPKAGRVEELEDAYVRSNPAKRPTLGADRPSESQVAASPQPPLSRLQHLDYRPTDPAKPAAPWVAALALHVDTPIPDHDVVRFCAALHRTLTSFLGADSSALLTGSYLQGSPQPPNRVALHYVEAGRVAAIDNPGGAFLVLLPQDADPVEAAVVERLTRSVRKVYRGALGVREVRDRTPLDATGFWSAPEPGLIRFWRPAIAAVPEINRPRKDVRWSLNDTALLSMGHLLRDRVAAPTGPPEEVRRARVQAIKDLGIWAGGSRRIPDSHVERYVHKYPESLVVQPYSTIIQSAGQIPDGAVWALGQSRHLGGGLMIPFDLAPDVAHHLLGWSPC